MSETEIEPSIQARGWTPHYVLVNESGRITANIMQDTSGPEFSVLYGFSSKGRYDRFCLASKSDCQPYPIVKVFLRDQIEEPGRVVKLIALDAVGPHEPRVLAATMSDVLAAHELKTTEVNAAHCLVFDERIDGYRVDGPPD